jgi:peptide deformylase
MSKLKIYKFPDEVLAKQAQPIAHVGKEYFKLADDMLETMYDAPGVGLAANQVGLLERIIVVDAEYEVEDPEETPAAPGVEMAASPIIRNKKPIILLNPEIIKKEGSTTCNEGCLSVPEFSAEVKRSKKIVVRYQDIDGLAKEIMAEGWLAVVLQHEIDHLEGKLFIDRLSPLKKDFVRKKLRKERAERDGEC